MTPGTFSLPLKDVKEVDSWYWHSPDDDKEWNDWFIDHGRYVSQLIVPDISWEQLSAGSMATSADASQPVSAAMGQVQPQIWALTWHVMKGLFEKYVGGKLISVAFGKGAELIFTMADGRRFRLPLKAVREWARDLLRGKGGKRKPPVPEFIADNVGSVKPGRALGKNPSKGTIPKVRSVHPALPIRNGKGPTHGIFNDQKMMMSGESGGDAMEVFGSNIHKLSKSAKVSLLHVEAHAVAEMVQKGIKEGTVHINYESGPCPFCQVGIPELMSKGQKLWVVFPEGMGYFTKEGWFRK